MTCKSCGATDLNQRLGKCAYCIGLALTSSICFWLLYYWLHHTPRLAFLAWVVFGFATLVTLLLAAHSLAFMSNRKKSGVGRV